VRFRRPVTKTNYFEGDNPIQTLLSRPINDALATAANLFKQFVIAEIIQRPRGARSGPTTQCWRRISCAIAFVLEEQAERCLYKAGWTRSSRRISKDLRSTFGTNFDSALRVTRSAHVLVLC
jgi:hypothetical protein